MLLSTVVDLACLVSTRPVLSTSRRVHFDGFHFAKHCVLHNVPNLAMYILVAFANLPRSVDMFVLGRVCFDVRRLLPVPLSTFVDVARFVGDLLLTLPVSLSSVVDLVVWFSTFVDFARFVVDLVDLAVCFPKFVDLALVCRLLSILHVCSDVCRLGLLVFEVCCVGH